MGRRSMWYKENMVRKTDVRIGAGGRSKGKTTDRGCCSLITHFIFNLRELVLPLVLNGVQQDCRW